MGRSQVIVAGTAVGVAAGYALRRAGQSWRTRRLLNGNYAWMNSQERKLVHDYISRGRSYVFKGWPRPGVRDQQKRALLTVAAASPDAPAATQLETARLAALQPPVAERRSHLLQQHNDERTDDYYWLRDDKREAKDVVAYLQAENAYTEAVLADTKELQQQLYQEMRGRIQEADVSTSTRYAGYYYYTRTEEGQQYKIHCRRKVPAGAQAPDETDAPDASQPEEIVLDENLRKKQGKFEFYMVGSVETSPNQQLLAWTEDTMGGEKYTLRVKDLATGKEVMAPLPMTSGDVMWANDNATLFYTVKDHLDRPYKVLRHKIGQLAGQEDAVVYEEKDEAFYVGIGRSHSEELLYIHAGSAVTNETHYLAADTPEGTFQVILPRQQDVEYDVSHHPGASSSSKQQQGAAGGWLVITLRDKTRVNSEVLVAPLDNPEQQEVLLAHRPEVKLQAVGVNQHWLMVQERYKAQQAVQVYRLPEDGSMPLTLGQGQRMEFDEPAYDLSGVLTGDFDSNVLRLYYDSLTTPPSTIDHDMRTGKRITKKVQPVLGRFAKEDYVTERHWVTASDGVEVPVSLVYRKGLAKLDGTDPCMLYGYGSYEISIDPNFSSNRLSLLDRGWVWAIGHIRGGGDMGRQWYEDGKFLKKKSTFTDFIACAEYLIKNKFSSPKRLCIEGRSAGGLLMGACLNMRPDLFSAVLAGVPFVDCLTTMLDDTIPLTTIEWEEWGNPAEKEYYDYMKSYSPVDNVKAQDYPNILVTAGLHDPRVGYWEPAKWVAKLRALKTDSNLLLLKTEMGAGHFSVTGRFERLKEVALEYAFLLKAQGMLDRQPLPGSKAAAGGAGSTASTGAAAAAGANKPA